MYGANKGLRASLLILAIAFAGCATPPPPAPEPVPEVVETPVLPPPLPPSAPAPEPARPAPAKPAKVPPAKPITLAADCHFLRDSGESGDATLEVRDGTVRRMRTVIQAPGQGQCVFELADMKQTRSQPYVELRGRQTRCVARIRDDGKGGVTITFTNCAERCTPPSVFSKVRPIRFDGRGSRCE